jgi:NADH:ubiquinone oxidoreductase subunit
MGDKLNQIYEASNADVAAMRMRMIFTRNIKEGARIPKG